MHSSVPLIMYEDSKRYYIPRQAQELLKSFGEDHIAVVSIIGKPKTGKSYILNHISQNPNEFEVNSHVMASNKGIRMSSKPFHLQGKRVLLLDNQSYSSSINSLHDSKMFFVNILLSSVLIYNNFGVIDEHALAHLSLIIGMNQISESTMKKDWNIQKPHLFWLVRDFILKLETPSGQSCTAKQYLQRILNQQKGLTSSITQKNCVRSMIREMFTKRDCETLVRPAKQQKDLHSLSKIPFQDLRKQFIDDVKRFKSKLGKCVKYKKVNQQLLTGSLLLKLIKSCLDSFNSKSSLPNVSTIWTMVQTEQKRQVSLQLEQIQVQIRKQIKINHSQSPQCLWEQKLASINTLNNSQIISLIKEKKRLFLASMKKKQETEDIVPITFQNINLNFLQSVVHKNYRLQDNFQSSHKNDTSTNSIPINSSVSLQKQLQLTKRELETVQQKCKSFEKQRQNIFRAIQTSDKQIDDIFSRKRDSVIFSKNEEQESNVVSKLLQMYQRLEQKNQKISQILKHTEAYICSHCKQKFQPKQFQRHIQKIKHDDIFQQKLHTPISRKSKGEMTITQPHQQPKASFFTPYIIIPKGILSVDIEKTLIKQDQQHRNYIQYIIKVSLKHSKWTINRKYKDFCELHDILMIMLPELQFPDSSALIKVGMLTNVSNNINKKNIVQERRKTLQNYLTSIIDIDEIRNTRILQKFLKVNQEYKELEYLNQTSAKSKSVLGFDFKNEGRPSMSKNQATSQSKRYTQSKLR